MAPRARATRSRAAPKPKTTSSSKPSQRQNTLSFSNNRITKSTAGSFSTQAKKADVKAVKLLQEDDGAATAKAEPETQTEIEAKAEEPETEEAVKPKTRSRAQVKAKAEAEEEDDIVDDDDQSPEPRAAKPMPIRSQARGQAGSNDPETAACKITETQIKRYWRLKEAERKTRRVHQQKLSVYEKVLREFDVENKYGPCIGITRLRRWHRAKNLDLDPPIEVLAVLQKSAANGDDAGDGGERAYIDILTNPRLAVAA